MCPELKKVIRREIEEGSDHEKTLKDFGNIAKIESVVGSVWGWEKFFGHFGVKSESGRDDCGF